MCIILNYTQVQYALLYGKGDVNDMAQKILSIGVDVGNFDTKTQSTVIPSGFVSYRQIPFGNNDYILYDGIYYMTNPKRFPYVEDKTVDDNMFILTLIAIAKEIEYTAQKKNEKNISNGKTPLGIQGEIDKIGSINLGIGLPLSHFNRNKDKYIAYYVEKFGDGIEYDFKEYHLKLKLNCVDCYPQDFSAVVTYAPTNPQSIMNSKEKTYYAVDIGGWTVDIMSVVRNELEGKGTSKPLGVLAMYEQIINEVDSATGTRIRQTDIEAVLKKEQTYIGEEECRIIMDEADKWFNQITNEMIQYGMLLKTTPVLFLGGGSQLFKPFIKKSNKFVKCEFIANQKANARGYSLLVAKYAQSLGR